MLIGCCLVKWQTGERGVSDQTLTPSALSSAFDLLCPIIPGKLGQGQRYEDQGFSHVGLKRRLRSGRTTSLALFSNYLNPCSQPTNPESASPSPDLPIRQLMAPLGLRFYPPDWEGPLPYSGNFPSPHPTQTGSEA